MDWLNYHHLLYFWFAAREGGVSKASERLRLAPSTVSGQIHQLEEAFGHKLFERSGRNLVLTDVGRDVFRYAEEIFGLGRELVDMLKGRAVHRPLRLEVGVADVLPKLVTSKLLEPCMALEQNIQLVCRDGKPETLFAELATHRLDVVISDGPAEPGIRVQAFHHLLGECGIEMFGAPELADRVRKGFPQSLDGAPVLLPTTNTALRRAMEKWFYDVGVQPRVIAEFEDSALLKVFGQAGAGLFATAAVVSTEIRRQYQVESVGMLEGISERFYAITVERELVHPGVVAISNAARHKLFGTP